MGNRARWRAIVGASAEDAGQAAVGWRVGVPGWVDAAPKRVAVVVAGLAAVAGTVLGGPVAGFAGLAYGGLAGRAALRRRTGRVVERARRRQLDGLCALAADLRAGLPITNALPSTVGPEADRAVAAAAATGGGSGSAGRIDGLARAAVRLAEQTGAPLADLLERIEADARAMDRGLAAAAAQAAGARATAMLLAGLPLGGIALGYGIGVDPLAVLLRTPIGAGCAVGAIVLQLAGLAWADRLAGSALRAA
ncbi:type II secretion system F family protein [Micromonospora sp. NPDC004704]